MKVVRSLLSEDQIASIVQRMYPLGPHVQAHLMVVGDNDTYLIQTPDWRGVCRLYSLRLQAGFSHEERQCELDWLLHLSKRGVHVSTPMPRREGGLLGQIETPEGARDIALFTWARGERDITLGQGSEGTALCGQKLAELHLATQDFQTNLPRMAIDRRRLVDIPMERITRHLRALQMESELSELETLAGTLQRRLASLPQDRTCYGFIHGDCNGENHHLTPEGQVVFFDMDLSGPGWFAYDLAVFLWTLRRVAMPLPDIAKTGTRLISGYQRVRSLAPWELEALDDLVLARHFWVMGEHIVDIPSLGMLRVGPEYWRQAVSRLHDWRHHPLLPSIQELLAKESPP